MKPQTPGPGQSSSSVRLVPNLQVLKPSLQPSDASPTSPSSAPYTRWHLASESALASLQAQVCKADLLGAHLEVVRAGNPSLVGTSGLVARETEGCFLLALPPKSENASHQHRFENQKGMKEGGEDAKSQPKHTLNTPIRTRTRTPRRFFKVVPKHNVTFLLRVPLPPPTALPNRPRGQQEQQAPTSINEDREVLGSSSSSGGGSSILEIPLQGNQLSNTLVTRASKKWKQRKTMDY